MTIDIDEAPHFRLIYRDSIFVSTLGFNLALDVKAYGRYETDNIEKIYFFVDGGSLKVLNIKVGQSVLNALNPDLLNVLPLNRLPNIELMSYGTGNLPSGVRHYCIQYYNTYLTETEISPLSHPIILSGTVDSGSTLRLKGGKIDTNTGLSTKIRISQLDDRYSKGNDYYGQPICQATRTI
jgi:hypothetical protein